MKKAVASLGSLFAASIALAQTADQHSQPPPQFSDYRIPIERAALPREGTFQYVDLAILALVLGLTAWIVLGRRSRNELRVVSVFSLGYFGFYRLGCVCSIGSIQNVSYALTHHDYRLPLTVAGFFVLPLVAALFFGRVFCGGACPMGAIQDLLLIRPVRVPSALRSTLEIVPSLYLGIAVLFSLTGTAFAICEYDPFVGYFRLHGHFWMIMAGALMLGTSLFIGRPYCRFLCPYGVLLGWCSQFAKRSVTVTPSECIQCHMCANACPFHAIDPPQAVPADRVATRQLISRTVLWTPLLCLAFTFAGWRLAPIVAGWDLRVHRAQVIRQAELHPSNPRTLLADAWDRHRHTNQEAYQQGAAVERLFAYGTPLLGLWFGLVVSMKALSLLRRRLSNDYTAHPGKCLSCARCYSACPIPHRTFGLSPLPLVEPAVVVPAEPVGGVK